MKKIILTFISLILLSGCVGYVGDPVYGPPAIIVDPFPFYPYPYYRGWHNPPFHHQFVPGPRRGFPHGRHGSIDSPVPFQSDPIRTPVNFAKTS